MNIAFQSLTSTPAGEHIATTTGARFQAVCPQELGTGFLVMSFYAEGPWGASCQVYHQANRCKDLKIEDALIARKI